MGILGGESDVFDELHLLGVITSQSLSRCLNFRVIPTVIELSGS